MEGVCSLGAGDGCHSDCTQVSTLHMVDLPESFDTLLSSSSLVQKRAMLIALSDSIREAEATIKTDHQQLSEYVGYIPSFISDTTLITGVEAELESMKLEAKNTRKVKTFWLNSINRPYTYSGVTHNAHTISNYPSIMKLMDKLNKSIITQGHQMDSCLITCYSTAKKTLSLHADNEEEICQISNICNFTIGSTRRIEFLPMIPKYEGPPVCSYDLEHCSVNIMKPGCQQVLKHRIVAGKHEVKGQNIRYSLSFCKYVDMSAAAALTPVSPVKDNIHLFENMKEVDKEQHLTDSKPTTLNDSPCQQNIDTVLFAGDSHYANLIPKKLGKGKINVINIARGGHNIRKTEATISDFCANNTSYKVVKVFVSVGTNDIRYCRRGVRHLTKPLQLLTDRINLCFPNADIFYQSLLPLPLENMFVRGNVETFNDLLFEVCKKNKVYFLDIFEDFLGYDRRRNSVLFEEEQSNVHLNVVGLGFLAKKYIYRIHSKNFDPRLF